MFFSVVIVNWNSRADLVECLQSLRVQRSAQLEIIVVDNGSSDDSADVVTREFSECRLLRETENLGFAAACNRGIDASTGEWVALLNNDAVADPDWALTLIAEARAAPADCGMLQSLMLYRSRPDTINSAGVELAYSGGGRDRKEGQPYRPEKESGDEAIFCPSAGAAAYRRTMLQAIRLTTGYFDPTHFLYYEDMDLGWRARLLGWSARYVPQSIVYHRWHGSSERHGRAELLVMANTNRIRMLLKNASPYFLFATAPRTIKELTEIIRFGGWGGIAQLAGAMRQGLTDRQQVTAALRCARRQVEREFRAQPKASRS